MSPFRFIALLAASILVGAVVSGVITMMTWNARIEGKAFHCADIGFGSYWTDIDLHRSAGDTLSPSWTWEELKVVRRNYIKVFFLLWAVISLIAVLILLFHRQGPSPQS